MYPTSQAVPVLNPREESVVVRKGVQIARMEQLDDMYVGNVLPAPTSPSEASPKDTDMLWDMVGNHVSSAEKEKLHYVLLEYSDVFSLSNDGTAFRNTESTQEILYLSTFHLAGFHMLAEKK